MAAAINTVANGGVYVQPSLVKGSATTFLGQVTGSDHSNHHRVVSTHAAHLTRTCRRVFGIAPTMLVPEIPSRLLHPR